MGQPATNIANKPPWWAYSLAYVSAILIALDAGIAMYYLIMAQSVIPFPMLITLLCITATVILNALIYANGGADALAYTLGKINAKSKPSKPWRALIFFISAFSGLLMAGFTLFAYLEIGTSTLMTLPFIGIMTAAYFIGTYNLIYYAMITSYEDLGATIENAITGEEPDNKGKRTSIIYALKKFKNNKSALPRFILPWLMLQVPTALANYAFTKGFVGLLAHHFGMPSTYALGVGIFVASFLFIGELFFATKASIWISGQLKKLRHAKKPSVKKCLSFFAKLSGIASIATAAVVLINGYGNMATTAGTSAHLLQGWIFGALGGVLSISVMAKNIYDLIQDKDTILPERRADKIKAITWSLVSLAILATAWSIQPLSAVFASQTALIMTVTATMLLLLTIGRVVTMNYPSSGASSTAPVMKPDGGNKPALTVDDVAAAAPPPACAPPVGSPAPSGHPSEQPGELWGRFLHFWG